MDRTTPAADGPISDAPAPADVEELGRELTSGFAGQLIRRAAYRIVRRLGLTRDDGEEIEQQLRLELFRRAPRFDPQRGAWRAFVRTVVARCAATCWRKRRQAVRVCSLDLRRGEHEPLSACVTAADQNRRTGLSPADPRRDSELRIDVQDALERQTTRSAGLCHKVMETSVARAAVELGLPRGTLRDRLKRLRPRFAGLDDYLPKKAATRCGTAVTGEQPILSTPRRSHVRNRAYRYQFESSVAPADIEASLLLAVWGTESLHGESRTRLDAAHALDEDGLCCVIDGTTEVGRTLNALFAGFVRREYGDEAFTVERVGHGATAHSGLAEAVA